VRAVRVVRKGSQTPENPLFDEEKKMLRDDADVLTILGAMMPANVTIFSGGGPVLCFNNEGLLRFVWSALL
jgi:hypothetical protein